MQLARRVPFAEVRDYAVHDLGKRCRGCESRKPLQFAEVRHPSRHIFKARFVGLIVGDGDDWRFAPGALFYETREIFDRNFVRVSDIDHFSDRGRSGYQAQNAFDRIFT